MTNKLHILCGIPFAGKSTLAENITKVIGGTRIDLDQIKFDLLGSSIQDSEIEQSSWDQIYAQMYSQIKQALKSGETVIHDTGNFTSSERQLISSIATELRIPYVTIFVSIPTEDAYKRLLDNRISKLRFNISDNDFNNAVAEMEIPKPNENTIIYKQTDDQLAWIQENLQ